MGLALLAILVWLFLIILPLMLGIYLVWKQTGIYQIIGWLILLVVAYRQVHCISPWYVARGSELVQEFKLSHPTYGSVRWMEVPGRLILVPDERVTTLPYSVENDHVLVIDLEARKSHWQPKAEIDLEQTKSVKPNFKEAPNLEPIADFSFVGFNLPFLTYQFSWPFGQPLGWQWEKTYFGWDRVLVRETKSGSVAQINRLILNSSPYSGDGTSGWVMERKFFVYAPDITTVASDLFTDRRIFVLGPFETSPNIQPQSIEQK